MKLKTGDRVLCKRDMTNRSKHLKYRFKRSQWYDVIDVSTYTNGITLIYVKSENGYPLRFSPKDFCKGRRFERYFNSERDIRRIKLEQILKLEV